MSFTVVPKVICLVAAGPAERFASLRPCGADEGMWLFNQPPRKQLKEKYGFEPTDAWLEHLQKSAVRFNSGGSGSFVSADGLVMTNHHVGADCLQKLSTADKDLIKTGFHAQHARRGNQVRRPGAERADEHRGRDRPGERGGEAGHGRRRRAAGPPRGACNTIEKESLDKTGLRSDVVTLYQGGQYHLYRYKKYTDVRLVFAPEKDIAFFGGDPDNFEYPRYDLDICFFRVYEDDKPAKIEHYLTWSKAGASDDELIFVAGHPGRTDRLEHGGAPGIPARSQSSRSRSNMLRRREVLLQTYSDRGLENARRAQDDLFGYQNSRKARLGGLAGLQDPAIMDGQAQGRRSSCAQAVANDPKLQRLRATPGTRSPRRWRPGTRSTSTTSCFEARHGLQHRAVHASPARSSGWPTNRPSPTPSGCANIAESGLRLAQAAALLRSADLSPIWKPSSWPTRWAILMEQAGADNPLVKQILAGKSPAARAAELVSGTKLADVAVPQEAGRRRQKRHRSVRRPDDRAGAGWSIRRPARSARRTKTRSTSRCGRPTPRSPRPASPSKATAPIPTPRSRSAWPSAR